MIETRMYSNNSGEVCLLQTFMARLTVIGEDGDTQYWMDNEVGIEYITLGYHPVETFQKSILGNKEFIPDRVRLGNGHCFDKIKNIDIGGPEEFIVEVYHGQYMVEIINDKPRRKTIVVPAPQISMQEAVEAMEEINKAARLVSEIYQKDLTNQK